MSSIALLGQASGSDPLTAVLMVVFFALLTVVFLGFVGYWIYQSFTPIGSGEKIYYYLFGSYRYTYVNDTYWAKEWSVPAIRAKVSDPSKVYRGILGGGFGFGCWPFTLGFVVPSTQIPVPIHAGKMYTRANPDLPRVRIEGDVTWQFRLADDPSFLGMVFTLFMYTVVTVFSKKARNLTRKVKLINGVSPSGSNVHQVPKISEVMYHEINNPTLEALRAASTSFSFSTSGGGDDIMENRRVFEQAVKDNASNEGDTIFRQARMLEGGGATGVTLLVCNLVVENLQLQPASNDDSEADKAIDYAFIGAQEGARQAKVEKLRRFGEAEGIARLAKRLGLKGDKQKAFLLDVLRAREGSINLSNYDITDTKPVLDAIQKYLGGTP